MSKIIWTTILLTLTLSVYSQQSVQTIADINFYADVTANAALADSRLRGHEQLYLAIDQWLRSDEYQDSQLDQLSYISVKRPDDDSFALLTWQVLDKDEAYHYYGFLRMADGTIHELKSDDQLNYKDLPYETLDSEHWYGALYYNMLATEVNGSTAYLLFGFDGHEAFDHRKVMDVLYFENGNPMFGAPIFELPNTSRRQEMANRVLVEYSNDAAVSLNYNEQLQMVTHDHLISRMGRRPGQGPTMVPDGSYIGYKWDDNKWTYIDKVYDQVSTTPPSDNRKRTESKGLFGKDNTAPKAKKSRD